MIKNILNSILFFLAITAYSQQNTIEMNVKLDTLTEQLFIQQKIVYYNTSKENLTSVFLHNWPNSYKNNNTPLAKRFLEDYKKEFHFSKIEERGQTTIKNLSVNYSPTSFKTLDKQYDIIEILLNKVLKPKDSIIISSTYIIKIPNSKFTGYGKKKAGYYLRYWYLTPAVYHKEWQLMNNKNIDDLYEVPSNYTINIQIPKPYKFQSNLIRTKSNENYTLKGDNIKDIILDIKKNLDYKHFNFNTTKVITNAYNQEVSYDENKRILNEQITFLQQFLNNSKDKTLFVDAVSIKKNSLHEIYGLPKWLKPFPENFRWKVGFFKALSKKYITQLINLNQRKDYWFVDGLQTFLMMEYIKKYYPEITLLGKYSNYWPIKNANIAKLKQNDKYAHIYQFSARKFYDQALNTSADSLSNFNRKVVSKYKAGLGFKYLQDYLGNGVLQKTIREFVSSNAKNSIGFQELLAKNTTKKTDWFFNDYINTSKKIDYKIKKVNNSITGDSLEVTIKNKRNISSPIALYGIQNKKIIFKQWLDGIDSTKTIKIKKGNYNKFALNFEQVYPEYNFLNNFRNTNNKLINKPLQFSLYKDTENAYYHQIFYTPNIKYNLYDGLILGVKLRNQPLIKHNFDITVVPNYSTKSKNFTGSYSIGYNHFFAKTNIYKITYGVSGSNFHYAPELGYNTFFPFVNISFRRNSLRDVGSKNLFARLIYIDKEVPQGIPLTNNNNYKVFNLRFINSKPNVIKRFQYALNAEISDSFTKFSTDLRYRKYFDTNKSYDIRFFGGFFIDNTNSENYFDFALNNSNDYLFEQNLFGRSERSGLFSQQFIVADGGFKSKFEKPHYANQFMGAINTSVSVWKWTEIYNGVAMLKNKNAAPKFFYENGVRLNFIPNIFELYFPVYNNQGFEVDKNAYPRRIRFVLTTNLDRIYNFIRRGIL